ncbi:probable serine/threonine-protein kinase PBL19, partial [Tanacetum coccineum]
ISFRDLKPSNTLLDRQMNANLFDFRVVREGPKDELAHETCKESWLPNGLAKQTVLESEGYAAKAKHLQASWLALIRLNDIQRAFNIDLEHRLTHRFKDQVNAIGLYCTKTFKDYVGAVYLHCREHFQTTLAGDHPTAVDKTKLVHSSLLLLALSHKKDPYFQLILVPKLRAYASKWPEDIDTPQPVIKINTKSTGTEVVADSTATLATASIVIKMVDSVLLSLQLFRFGDKYRTNYPILLQQHREKMCKAMKDISDARAISDTTICTSKADAPYKIGGKSADVMLEVFNLDKKEIVSIALI